MKSRFNPLFKKPGAAAAIHINKGNGFWGLLRGKRLKDRIPNSDNEVAALEIGDALYICSFPKKGFVIVILYAKTITN